MVTNVWNTGVQGNENSFFTCYLKVVLDRFFEKKKSCPRSIFWRKKKVVLDGFFENLKSVPDDSISHYWRQHVQQSQWMRSSEYELEDIWTFILTLFYLLKFFSYSYLHRTGEKNLLRHCIMLIFIYICVSFILRYIYNNIEEVYPFTTLQLRTCLWYLFDVLP